LSSEHSQDSGFFDHWAQMMQHRQGRDDDNAGAVDSVELTESVAVSAEELPAVEQTLNPDGRKALVMLMQRGVLLAAEHPKVFAHLQRQHAIIRSRLEELHLELVLDEREGVGFIRQRVADEDEETFSGLIQPRTLTLFDTLVLLVLRKHYQERENAGEQRILVDLEQLEAGLMPFLPLTNSSRLEKRQLAGTLTRFKERKLLREVRGEEGRYEITPVLRYVVNADFLQQMLADYRKLAQTEAQDGEGGGE